MSGANATSSSWAVLLTSDSGSRAVLLSSRPGSGHIDELLGDGTGSWGLDTWWALVGGLNSDTLARAVLLDLIDLTGNMSGTVVVVVLVVDIVHIVVDHVRFF